ncbi:MAG: hypothetical protein Q8K18_06390 [Burkholderiales bacterium]|nr:hypothetical protein [Burkholderiales bacterium]
MQCTLFIPHLLPSGAIADQAAGDLPLTALRRLLARARHQRLAPVTAEAWLCRAFEVEKQQDWPVAPLTLTLDGIEPEARYWLRADPVHLRLRRDQVLLADCSVLGLSKQDADDIVAFLNQHFAQDGLCFIAPHAGRWYLGLERAPQLATRALSEVTGEDIHVNLPTGEDALHWHKIANEIQILLHSHPLNDAREARGEMTVNSVWLWGGGTRPSVPGRHFSAVWSDEALPCALAAHANLPATPLPADAGQWLHATGSADSHHLIVFGQLAAAAQYGDMARWREHITALDRDWIAPLLAALQRRRISRLTLALPGHQSSERFELTPADLLKFWRSGSALPAYRPSREP